MSDLVFLKVFSDVNLTQMPGKDRQKVDAAVFMCQANGPEPAELLQVGLAILRSLSIEKPLEGKQPVFWTFLGLVEWVKACSPEEGHIRTILHDLRVICPHTKQTTKRLLNEVIEKKQELRLAAMKIEMLLN